jgi:hypothetical protein
MYDNIDSIIHDNRTDEEKNVYNSLLNDMQDAYYSNSDHQEIVMRYIENYPQIDFNKKPEIVFKDFMFRTPFETEGTPYHEELKDINIPGFEVYIKNSLDAEGRVKIMDFANGHYDVVLELNPNSFIDQNAQINDKKLYEILNHELIHVYQFMIEKAKKIKNFGHPSKKQIKNQEEYTEEEKPDKKERDILNYLLQDVEYQPFIESIIQNLKPVFSKNNEIIKRIESEYNKNKILTDEMAMEYDKTAKDVYFRLRKLRSTLRGDNTQAGIYSMFMKALKEKAPDKWKKAVSEIFGYAQNLSQLKLYNKVIKHIESKEN